MELLGFGRSPQLQGLLMNVVRLLEWTDNLAWQDFGFPPGHLAGAHTRLETGPPLLGGQIVYLKTVMKQDIKNIGNHVVLIICSSKEIISCTSTVILIDPKSSIFVPHDSCATEGNN